MRGTTVLAAALFLAAAPVGAQQYTWTEDRPDGVAPAGIWGDRTLPKGTVEVGYRYGHARASGFSFGTDQVTEESVLDLGFTFAPLEQTTEIHWGTVGVGATDYLTLMARGGWVTKDRTTGNDSIVFFTEASGISDIQLDGLWEVYHQGAYRAHLHTGVIIPTGAIDERGDFGPAADVQLPYDMQIGQGSWTIVPGATAQVMNDVGSVGLQVRGLFAVNDNDRGWKPGTRVDGRLWAGYRFNDFVSASGGIRAVHAEAIEGADVELETLRDPGDLALSTAMDRVDLPFGVNLRIPSGPLMGERISFEGVWTVHQKSDGPLLKGDWAFNLGWQAAFDALHPERLSWWPF